MFKAFLAMGSVREGGVHNHSQRNEECGWRNLEAGESQVWRGFKRGNDYFRFDALRDRNTQKQATTG